MKIVILDGYAANPGDLNWQSISALGEVTVYDRTPPELVVSRIGDAEAVLMNKIIFSGEMLDRCPNLRFIGIMATGYNIIDLDAASQRGITVCNVPAYSTPSVVQHTFALLLELCAHTGEHAESIRAGDWQRNADFCYWKKSPTELFGKTIGLVGLGQIGKGVANVAQAFGMNVLACVAHPRSSDIPGVTITELDDLLANSDIISLHCPLTNENARMINAETISKTKPGVIIINTARGGLVDEHAIAEALSTGRIGGYGADVLTEEPPISGSPLIGAENCILTPHIAWASIECRKRLLETVEQNLRCFIEGRPQNVVNKINK